MDAYRSIFEADAQERTRLAGNPVTSWRLFDCDNATKMAQGHALFPGELTAREVAMLEALVRLYVA